MADRWMDERDRRMRERDWRRSEDMNRGGEGRFARGEDRSFGGDEAGDSYFEARRSGPDRDRVFGERETGMGYGGEGYGRPEGRFAAGRGSAYRGGRPMGGGAGGRGGWQDRDYGGVSPAMQQGEYDAEHEAERYDQAHGYGQMAREGTRGGRYYGDAGREAIYREEWSQGRRDYGAAPRGYDYERGDRGERWEARGREMGRDTGDFFRRAGERVSSWLGRDRDFRGMGPKGYKRADERISDEVHERLTDDPYVDASNISVSVSDGEVTLSGTVESREAKHRAERCVEDISGVGHVQNNLRVDRGNPLTSAGRGYGDSVLEHQMRGETGAGERLAGNSMGGPNGAETGSTTGRPAGTDTGKSR